MENNITFPEWYRSTSGPGTSQTLANIAGSFLPVINLALATKGIHVFPESINFWINIGVFSFFSIKAALGYIKAKKIMGAQMKDLEMRTNGIVGADKNIVWYGPHPCQRCDKDGRKGTSIVKAGNGAPDEMEYDFTHDNHYPSGFWKRHRCD